MLKKIIRQFSKEQFNLENLPTSKRDSIISIIKDENKENVLKSPTGSTSGRVDFMIPKKRNSNASSISNASYRIKDVTEEFKYNNVYLVSVTSLKTSVYENCVDSDEEDMLRDTNESHYVYQHLKAETNFGKLKLEEKEDLNELKKSHGFKQFKRAPLELFHDDYFFTETKNSVFRQNTSSCSSLNASVENIFCPERQNKLISRIRSLKKNNNCQSKIDSDEEGMTANLEERQYICASLKEELKFGKLEKGEKIQRLKTKKKSFKSPNTKSDQYLNCFTDDFFLSNECLSF